MVVKTTEELMGDYLDFVEGLQAHQDPLLYMRILALASETPEDVVRSCMYFGAMYDIGATWALFKTIDPVFDPPPWWWRENSNLFRPMRPSRRTANTDETLARVFADIHRVMPSIVDVVNEGINRSIRSCGWSKGFGVWETTSPCAWLSGSHGLTRRGTVLRSPPLPNTPTGDMN